MTNPKSFPAIESRLRNNQAAFRGGAGMPGNFRYEPQSSAKGNGGGGARLTPGAECGGNSNVYGVGNGVSTYDHWAPHYMTDGGVPVIRPGDDVQITGTNPADHGGQFWVMVTCDAIINAQSPNGDPGNNWVYLERKNFQDNVSPNSMPGKPRIVDWKSGTLRTFDFTYVMPANFGCASGKGLGRWVWKTGNSCIDSNNVGRTTEKFNAMASATGRGPCRGAPETFISCFIFTTTETAMDAPASPIPPPMMGEGDPMAQNPMTPPQMNPERNPMCTPRNCPETYCQNDCGRFSLAVCNGPNDGSWCRQECCCPFRSNCNSPNSVQSQSGIMPGQSFMVGAEAIPYVAATGRNTNCMPCTPGTPGCMLQTCSMGACENGMDPSTAVTAEQCNVQCSSIYEEGPDGTTPMGMIAPGNSFKQHQDMLCGTGGMSGSQCTCSPLPAEQPTPQGMMCRLCNPDMDASCTATGEVGGAWCAEHCSALHFGDTECGAIPMPGMESFGTHCVCSRVQAQQVMPGTPGTPVNVAPVMPGPAVPSPPVGGTPPTAGVSGACRNVIGFVAVAALCASWMH